MSVTQRAVPTQQTPYPMGPLSLVQFDGYPRWFKAIRHRLEGRYSDAYDLAIHGMAYNGVYPTFGHINGRTRRWYSDLWTGRKHAIGVDRITDERIVELCSYREEDK